MSTLFQWIHVTAAVVGVGGIAFAIFCLIPAARALAPAQREALFKNSFDRFRWIIWSVILLLIVSGIYNTHLVWQAPWGIYWKLLTIKIILAFAVFFILLLVTVPLKFLAVFRRHMDVWFSIAFGMSVAIILIAAYLRRG